MVEGVWEKFGAFVHQQIVWAKDRGMLTRSNYALAAERCSCLVHLDLSATSG